MTQHILPPNGSLARLVLCLAIAAIESEASDSRAYYRRIDQSGFARKERNLHCDVHVAAENKHMYIYCRRLGL